MRILVLLLFIFCRCPFSFASELLSPRPGAQVFHRKVLIEIAGCNNPSDFDVTLSGTHENPFRPTKHWSLHPETSPHNQRAWAWLPLDATLPFDTYTLDLKYHCQKGQETRELSWFDIVDPRQSLARYAQLGFAIIENYTQGRSLNSLDWSWQDAIFLLGVQKFLETFKYLRLEEGVHYRHPQEDRVAAGLLSYFPAWYQKGLPSINRPDPCAPALPGALLLNQTGNQGLRPALEVVAQYLRQAPRLSIGALNHLGQNNLFSFFYPQSIWVDSLVMYGLFASHWGWITADRNFHKFGMAQPLIFAHILQDPYWGLFRHAWFPATQGYEPNDAVFWLRGNGWAGVSFIETLALQQKSGALSAAEQKELETRFRILLDSALQWLPSRGLWNTVLNLPQRTYPEVSGSALFAYSMLKGLRLGYINAQRQGAMAQQARVIADSILQRLQSRTGSALSVPEISGPTNPSDLARYEDVAVTSDKGYGVGAVLMAISELMRSEGI